MVGFGVQARMFWGLGIVRVALSSLRFMVDRFEFRVWDFVEITIVGFGATSVLVKVLLFVRLRFVVFAT